MSAAPPILTRTDLAAHLTQTAYALREYARGVSDASQRVAKTGEVTPDDWRALADAQDAHLRVPASTLLLLASFLEAPTGPLPPGARDEVPRQAVARYLVLLAQTLRSEEAPLRGASNRARERGDEDVALVVEAVRAALLEQASMALVLATWLEGSNAGPCPG